MPNLAFKGSKKFRNILTHRKHRGKNVAIQQSVVTFFRLISVPVPDTGPLEKILGFWNNFSLPNNLREFSFKFHNNSLGLNTRISHFVEGQSRNCSFCQLLNKVRDETFPHLFFECETTSSLRTKFKNEFCSDLNLDITNEKLFWFTGILNNKKNFCLTLITTLFNNIIWNYKLRKKIPSYNSVKYEYFGRLKAIYKICLTAQLERTESNLSICRNLEGHFQRFGDG